MNATLNGVPVTLRNAPGFTFDYFDTTDPSKVKGNNSTSIEIVADHAARTAIGSVNMSEVVQRTHTLEIGEGYWSGRVVVDSITPDTITVVGLSGNASWMDAAKNLRLRDIELGVSDTITAAVQRASWTDEDTTLHFPLIDYGPLEVEAAGFNVPGGYLLPAVRVWKVLTAGFAQIGYPVQAVGRFGSWWKKLIMPAAGDDVLASEQYRQSRIAEAQLSNPTIEVASGTASTYIPDIDQELSDPSFSYNAANNRYTTNVSMYLRPVVTLRIVQSAGTFGGIRLWHEVNGGLPSGVNIDPTDTDNTGNRIYEYTDLALPPIFVSGGVWSRLRIDFLAMNGAILNIDAIRVKWEPTSIPYSLGTTVEPSSILPKDWTLADLVKETGSILNLKWITNDVTGVVEVMHYDDTRLPIEQGTDLSDRAAWPVTKVVPPVPSRYLFSYADDDNDRDLTNVNNILPDLKWGQGRVELGGIDDPVEVDTKFAPTFMGAALDGTVFVPYMRHRNAALGQGKLELKPRLLIADGVTAAIWEHESEPQEVQPKVFFVWPGEQVLSLDYGANAWFGAGVPGTSATYFGGYLRMVKESTMLRVPLRLHDHELRGFEFRRPVYVDAGFGPAWYYVVKIDQKQFGVDGYTECELIQA